MNRLFILLFVLFFSFAFYSCKKESFITSPDALLRISEDTLHFDTVFTSTGSTTQYLQIFNLNDQGLKINVELMGGLSSPFKINLDGVSGTIFNNVEILKNDSMYMFATVSINPTITNLPFVVRDSIKFTYNGNVRWLQLEAFGRNAYFLRNKIINTDTTFANDKPIVILGGLQVNENKQLTIPKGTKIYCNADAPIIVKGTLRAIGEKWDSTKIYFQGNRLDEPYKNYPASWPGIYFDATSKDNIMQFCVIKNSYQGTIALAPSVNTNPKLTIQECIIDNTYDIGIGGSNSSIVARNCLVSNAGYNVSIVGGGNYNFNYCTFVSYSNSFINHKNPVMNITNAASSNTSNALNMAVSNSILYGEGGLVDNEIVANKVGTNPYSITMNNVLYKLKIADPSFITFSNSLRNVVPVFDTVNTGERLYNFRHKTNSPTVNKGFNNGLVSFDLDGNPRVIGSLPDIGCYEKQ